MPNPQKPVPFDTLKARPFDPMAAKPAQPIRSTQPAPASCETKEACDRCGGEVYRMHAVWRCVQCGFKSDCCGW